MVRLSVKENKFIVKTIRSYDAKAKVYLFGSRTDIHSKGGDIDLFVLSNKINIEQVCRIKIELYKFLGDQKIDIIVNDQPRTAFEKAIFSEAVEL